MARTAKRVSDPIFIPPIRQMPLDSLLEYEGNSRKHTAVQIRHLKASMRQFGFTNPLIVWKGGQLIAGHARLQAAKALKIPLVPVIDMDHLTEAQREALVIADNRLAEVGSSWDRKTLRAEMAKIMESGEVDLEDMGLDDASLADLLGEEPQVGLTDPDSAPALPTKPTAQPGDVWLLGVHRVMCGDCEDAGAVAMAIGDEKPVLMVTDPPYGVEYKTGWRGERAGPSKQRAEGKITNDHRADWTEAWRLFPGNVAYVWHADLGVTDVVKSLEDVGFVIRNQIIWEKTKFILGKGNYHQQHEPALYAVKQGEASNFRDQVPEFEGSHEVAVYLTRKGQNSNWRGGRKQTTVWQIPHFKSETGHASQKPVDCMMRPMLNNSAQGQAVYDPFLGSGTSVIAGHIIGRVVVGLEIDPGYVDVIVRRWEEYTGMEARLEETGETFAQVKEFRQGDVA